jgi:hypothetical protein
LLVWGWLGWGGLGRSCGQGLDADGRDAMAIHFFYYEATAFIVKCFAAGGHLL